MFPQPEISCAYHINIIFYFLFDLFSTDSFFLSLFIHLIRKIFDVETHNTCPRNCRSRYTALYFSQCNRRRGQIRIVPLRQPFPLQLSQPGGNLHSFLHSVDPLPFETGMRRFSCDLQLQKIHTPAGAIYFQIGRLSHNGSIRPVSFGHAGQCPIPSPFFIYNGLQYDVSSMGHPQIIHIFYCKYHGRQSRFHITGAPAIYFSVPALSAKGRIRPFLQIIQRNRINVPI